MAFSRWLRNQWDRSAAIVAAGVGLVAVVAGWFGVSGVTLPSEQIPYLVSGAVFGMYCLGVAATLWLSADLRDEWRKLDDIRQGIRSEDVESRSEQGEQGPSVTLPEVGTDASEDESWSEPARVGPRRLGH